MYLHIGNMKSVRDKDVLGIFNLDGQRTTQMTATFLKTAEKKQCIENVDMEEIPKSFVLLTKKRKMNKNQPNDSYVLLSPISSNTLFGRFTSNNDNLQ